MYAAVGWLFGGLIRGAACDATISLTLRYVPWASAARAYLRERALTIVQGVDELAGDLARRGLNGTLRDAGAAARSFILRAALPAIATAAALAGRVCLFAGGRLLLFGGQRLAFVLNSAVQMRAKAAPTISHRVLLPVEEASVVDAPSTAAADGVRLGAPVERDPTGGTPVGWVLPECFVCMDASGDHVLYPCGHGRLCSSCARSCQEAAKGCPLCREPFAPLRVYE